VEISVITCSHNPREDYLKQVIEALKNQELDKRNWEYLLIDNTSDEPLEQRVDLSWHPNARHVREEKLGLTHARLRGMREANGETLVFVDDDNVLDTDYLDQALRIANEWPILGAFGGQVRPAFEETPADWTKRYWSRLVIREFDENTWSNVPSLHETMPSGAGLCVRSWVAKEYSAYHSNGKRSILMDRKGSSLVSGGDIDLAATSCDVGLGVGLFASLKVCHLISRDRLQEDYLVKLVEAMAFSGPILNSFRSNGKPVVGANRKTKIADLARMALMNRRDRRFFRAVRSGERKAAKLLGKV
jgi:glycosyltransferase involved in cell wall biosynthesis